MGKQHQDFSIQDSEKSQILLVEDAQGLARMVQRILGRRGFSVHAAVTGREALAWLENNEPLLLLLDFNLPDMNAREIIETLQSAQRQTPFIVMTGQGDERVAVDMMKLGAIDYLIKDDAFMALLPTVVTQACDRLKTQQRLASAEQKLNESEAQLRILVRAIEQSPSLLMVTDCDGRIEYVNPVFCETTGYSPDEVIGQTPEMLRSGSHEPDFYVGLWQSLHQGKEWRGEFYNRRKNGESYWERAVISAVRDAHDQITHFLKVAEDITAHKTADEKIHHLTYFDALTGLANQVQFRDRLGQLLPRAQRNRENIMVAVLDLDQFERINNAYGHNFGDKVLKGATHRLREILRGEDFIARFWGDRFLLAMPHLQGEQNARQIVHKLQRAFSTPFSIEHREVYVSASIGAALFPHDGTSVDALIKNAEAALGLSKQIGPNRFYFYNPQINVRATDYLKLQADMRKGLERGEFELYYQPLFETSSKRLVGAEALVRWQHPVFGLLAPGRFIDMAEETNLICPLGEWIVGDVCRQLNEWQTIGPIDFKLSVNLSPRQFHGSDILSVITHAVNAYNVQPAQLGFELTESLLMKDTEHAARILGQMKSNGFQLALDDFGTGYSSLSYLQKFPFDILKIDKSFVMDSERNPQNAAICRAVIAMAQSLGLKSLAEGVEKIEHEAFLQECGCELMQGFFLGRPVPVVEFEESWLKKPFC